MKNIRQISFKVISILFLSCLSLQATLAQDIGNSTPTTLNISPDKALDLLTQGNNTYLKSESAAIDRKSIAQNQYPFAIVLSCADSRVSPEIIFNQFHVGNLFVIRNAGNLADDIVLGSIEYGIEHLKAPLIIVLGHERCGAVTATIDAEFSNKAHEKSYIQSIIEPISPIAKNAIKSLSPLDAKNINPTIKDALIKKTSQDNIKQVMYKISHDSEIVSKALSEKKVKIVGAYYDLDEGNLEFIN